MAGMDERAPRRRRSPAAGRRASVVIRRARDRGGSQPGPPSPPPLPSLDELLAPEGRTSLEALLRRHGARASHLVRALAQGWRRADGSPPGEPDLRALLEAHGLRRSFERRERDAALHAVRAAGGVLRRAADALGIAAGDLDALLRRTGGAAEAEALREERRADLRRRATLSERVRLLLAEAERLADLGLLDEFEADLRQRLPEHLKALRAGGAASLAAALGRSLSLERAEVASLAGRLGLDLGPAAPPGAQPGAGERPRQRRPPAAPRPERRPGPRRRPPL
jgi:hypothetical protein